MRSFFIFLICVVFFPTVVSAAFTPDSPAVILVEQTTGRVLYSVNERERRYPANLTKMVTALVAVDELELTGLITIGTEIRGMPAGFATNALSEGETVTVHTLLYSLLVRSANEAGRILALEVIRSREGNRNITLEQANPAFARLLNAKAQSIGATGTNFNNAFGFRNENHFSTAYDLALITRAFMDNPILAEIAGTQFFSERNWTNTNQMLPGGTLGYPYMTGAKAGFNTSAGHVLAGAASHGGLQLVTITLGGTDAARWQDTRRLLDYGFSNFAFREVARTGDAIKEVLIENPRLGERETFEIILGESPIAEVGVFTALLSLAEFDAIETAVSFDPLLYVETESETPTLRAPFEYGTAVGTVTFYSAGTALFEVPVLSPITVLERNFDSDMDYYLAAFFGSVFSRQALPYYFGIFGIAFGIFGIILAIRANRRIGRGWRY